MNSIVLSIVVPRYSETEKGMFPLLSSIHNQLGVESSAIELIVVNDGSGVEPLSPGYLSLFDLSIRQITLSENSGPGVARQAGLDVAAGEYVMFCDADDILHSVGVLGTFINEITSDTPDMITSDWLEEQQVMGDDGTPHMRYELHRRENIWLHGKLFRREFLEENRIRFHEKLRVHEDSYFLAIASALAKKRSHIPITSYVWKFNPSSITRRGNGIYIFETFPTFIEACCMSHGEIRYRCGDNYGIIEYKIIQFVLYVYFNLHRPEWLLEQHVNFLDASEDMFREKMKPYWIWWDAASRLRIAEIYSEERTKNFGGLIESETLDQWLERIREEE